MAVLVVLGAVAAGLALAWELRLVVLWVLVRVVDALEGAEGLGRRRYGDFRRVVGEQGVAGLELAWRGEPDGPDVADRPDWQLRSA